VKKIRIVECRDHSHSAEFAALDEFACVGNRRIKRMTMANNQMHSSFVRCGNHGLALGKGNGHRLLGQHMLAGSSCNRGVRSVVLVWRRHVHDFYALVGAKRFDGIVGSRIELSGNKARASGLGSAAATSAIRGSRVSVGNITVNPRPRPATPSFNFRVRPTCMDTLECPNLRYLR